MSLRRLLPRPNAVTQPRPRRPLQSNTTTTTTTSTSTSSTSTSSSRASQRRNLSTPPPPFSNPPPPPKPTNPSSSTSPSTSRLTNLLLRLPPSLRNYTAPLLHAPATHVTSFLLLHELTAVIPLLGLTALFHYTNWLPQSWTEGRYVREGVERFGKWFGRRGWFGFTPAAMGGESGGGGIDGNGDGVGQRGEVEGVDVHGEVARGGREKGVVDVGGLEEEVEKRWNVGESGGRLLVEVATAYAITKVFLPARIVLSVWCTPWFARAVLGRAKGLFGRGKVAKPGSGTKDIIK